MSDSFADLWASSAPTKSTPAPPQNKTAAPRKPQYDAFSILSASQPASKHVAAASLRQNDRQAKQAQPTSNGGDAFSSLFTSSLDGTANGRNPDRANLTMAERTLLAHKAKSVQNGAVSARISPGAGSSSLWDGLDTLARPTTDSPRPAGNAAAQDDFDFGFGGISAASETPAVNSASVENDDWGLSEFSSLPPSDSRHTPASGSKPATLWDLDDFGSSEPRSSQRPSRSLTGTPGDFDFGEREDGLLEGDDSDAEDTFGVHSGPSRTVEDDILGDLGKPMSHSHSPSPNPPSSTPPVLPPRTSTSPPPHITGQLVEMGFSPIDARAALVNTMAEDGFDIQAATELLLSQACQEGSARPSPRPREHERRRDGERDGNRDRAVRPRPPTRTDPHSSSSTSSQSRSQSQPQLDITAEKLLSQASEIGRGMFNKANALWKEGKERAVKMYEERAASNSAPAPDGRPRWMREHDYPDSERQPVDRNAIQATFKDDEDEGHGGEREERPRPPARRSPQAQPQSRPPPPPEPEREIDLFSVDSPAAAYQSPFRRGKPKTQVTPSSQTPVSASPGSSTSPQSSQPPRIFTTTIAHSALFASTTHKTVGTDAYKRGDFPVALAAYTRAISALPSDHILRVPILTNLALIRSKVGELRETIKACEEAVVIVRRFVGGSSGKGMSFTGTESDFDERTPVEVGTGKVTVTVEGGATPSGDLPTSVDLVEGLSKAFRRRAEALEGLEKWESARNAWEVLLGAEWAGAGVKGDAVKGVGRCRRMVDGTSQTAPSRPKPNPTPQSRPKPKPTPQPSVLPPSAALNALRSTQDAQQNEDAARLACKDTVDTRLTAWKSGREGNIRALLTSLDESVLWPELGWRKVGMAEVVSKGQVKGAYMRAIARVHPDKLNAENTTVEQRMIANGVFGTLNEAWNVFQQQ